MCTQEVTLTWDGHHLTLLGIFEKLLEKGSLVDCILTVEGKQLKVHKEVLSAFSPFFQLLFEEENEQTQNIVLSGFTYQDLSALIHYMYCGRVQISEDRMENLIDSAKSLHIEGLGGAQEKIRSEYKDVQSKAFTSLVNESCRPHKKRKYINGMETAGVSVVSSGMEVRNQEPPISVLQLGGDSSKICSTYCLPSSVNYEQMGSNVPLLSHEQPIMSFHNNNVVSQSQSITEVIPGSNVQVFILENELSIQQQKEEESRNASFCQLGSDSYKSDDGDLILDLSEIRMNNAAHKLNESLPIVQSVSDYSILPSSDLPCEIVSPLCIRGTVIASRPMNEQSRYINTASSDYPILTSRETEDEMFTSEFILEPEPIPQAILTEGTEEPEEMVLGGDMESEQQEKNSKQSPDAAQNIKEPMKTQLSEGICVGRSAIRGKSSAEDPVVRSRVSVHQKTKCGLLSQKSFKKSHRKRNTQKWKESLKCSECPYITKFTSHLKRHKRTHTGDKPFKCLKCDYATGDSTNLNLHMLNHSGEKPYHCLECDYTTARATDLTKHMNTHTGDKPHKCSECDYSTGNSSNLTIHKRIHTGEKPFKCSECDYATGHPMNLTVHMRTHTRIKPYNCSECDFATGRSSEFTRHMGSHTGEYPYKCTECDYAAKNRTGLHTHKRIHK